MRGVAFLTISCAGWCAESADVIPVQIPGVQNAFRVTQNLYSGSEPEGDAAFAALAKLGVKTIVSVDGVKPNLKAAHENGLRYVHLPFGYDGVPTNRLTELASLNAAVEGPLFVHCHHGQHRGPTAVAILCLASGDWTTNRAEAWLREAGTSKDYAGLYQSVRGFRATSQRVAAKDLPETAQTATLVDAMVVIDEHFDRLKAAQKTGWANLNSQENSALLLDTLLLREQFRELARATETAQRPTDFLAKLNVAENRAGELHRLLAGPSKPKTLEAAFKQAAQNCAACHKAFRN